MIGKSVSMSSCKVELTTRSHCTCDLVCKSTNNVLIERLNCPYERLGSFESGDRLLQIRGAEAANVLSREELCE